MISLLAFLVVVMIAAAAVAWLVRRAGPRSEGIVAGLLVGVLMGPTVLGRIAPDWWAETMIGASEARALLDRAVSERQAFTMAANAAEIPLESRAEGMAERDAGIEIASLEAAEQMLRHARPWSILTMVLAVTALWLGWSAIRRSNPKEPSPGIGSTVSLACWVVLLPGFLTILVLRLAGWSPLDPATLLVAIAVSVSAWPTGGRDTRTLRRLGVWRFTVSTALVATMLLIIPAFAARVLGSPAWSIIALPILVFSANGVPVPDSIRARRRARHVLNGVILPGLAAISVLRSDVLLQTPWLATIGLILIAGDGRAISWLVGLRFSGLPSPEEPGTESPSGTTEVMPTGTAWKTAMLTTGAGGSQLAYAAAATALGGIGPGITFSLVLGAAGMDLFGPSRRRVAGA